MSKKTGKTKTRSDVDPAAKFKRLARGTKVEVWAEYTSYEPYIKRYFVEVVGTVGFRVPGTFKTRDEALQVAKDWRRFFQCLKEGVYKLDVDNFKKHADKAFNELQKPKKNRTAERVARAKRKTPRDRNLTLADRAHAEFDTSYADEVCRREFEGG